MKKKAESLIKLIDQYGAKNYHPLPVVLNRGKGAYVWDVEGKKYLDFLSCYSALNFGHQNPKLIKALQSQLKKLALCSRAFYSEELSYFSKELADFTGLEMVLPMNSGAEAVETAIKIARRWGYEKKNIPEGQAKIITFSNNFHGRTVTVVSFSSEVEYKRNFGPFTPGFDQVPFGNLQALRAAITPNTVGILGEPIQAEAGILVPPEGFLADVKKLAKEKNVLWMVDEIQTGMGRTGKNFCFEYEDAKPDLLILGKSLGGGLLPVSAVVGTRETMELMRPGSHGSTFGGNPLACAVAREALRILDKEKMAKKAERIGEICMNVLSKKNLESVKQIRGKGALIGIELHPSMGGARRYCEAMAQRGLLCKETHTHVIRIAPPLTISDKELKQGLDILVKTVEEMSTY